jgi:hypothetical protein
MEIRFILFPETETETERAFRRRKKGGFDSLALSRSQFSSQCYSFFARFDDDDAFYSDVSLMHLLIKHETQRLGEN